MSITYKEIINKIKCLEKNLQLSTNDIDKVKQTLNVDFSYEFYEISKNCSYEFVGNFNFYNFGLDNEYSVIFETIFLRESCSLKSNYIIIYQEAESAIFIKCCKDKEIIYYIALEDIQNLIDEKPFVYNHQIFPSYTDFFAYLIECEEAEKESAC